jgi:hypothetical protein
VLSVTKFPLLGDYRVLRYIRGGVALRGPSTVAWIIKVWMFSASNMGAPCVTASGKTLPYVPNVRYPRQPNWVTLGKEKYGSFLGK